MKSVEIKLYAYFENKHKFVYEYETYDCDVLFVVEKGVFRYIDEKGESIIVSEGETVLCPKGFTFKRYVEKAVDLHMIRFSYDEIKCRKTKKFYTTGRMKEDLCRLKILWNSSGMLNPDKIHYCADFVREILYEENKNKYPSALLKIIDYIHNNPNKPISNKELCSVSYLSEVSVISLMKKHLGKTPNEYITSQRISAAQKLLSETDEIIKSIAHSVGFNDNLYFSKVFKKETGMTPCEFRKRYFL